MPQQRIPIVTHGALSQDFALEADGALLRSRQDCTAIADANKRASNDFVGTSRHGTAIAARVPVIYRYVKWPAEFEARYGLHPQHPNLDRYPSRLHAQMRAELSEQWAAFFKAKLNHPDFRHFRTDGGRRL